MEAAMAERTVSATEARVHFGKLLDSVTQKGEVVLVERAGVPLVAVVPINVWKLFQQTNDPWAEALRDMEEHWEYMRKQREAGLIKEIDIDAAEIIRRGREERDEQLLGDLLGQ
jgi:prevent-host-death family protein